MKHRILVLGAGYAGATAAGRLGRRLHREDVEITVVNAEPDFVERIRMHQVATGQQLRHRPLRDLLHDAGVSLRVARVIAVDAESRTVHLTGADGAEKLGYDTLVYALGSTLDDGGVPGVAEYAHEVASRPGALRLHERLNHLDPGAPVVVVGGGLTGIEAVSEIADAYRQLDVALMVRGELGDWLSAAGRRHLRAALRTLGVTVHEHSGVERIGASQVVTCGRGTVPAEVSVWAAGFTAHPIAAASTLTVSERGRIVVDQTMRSVSHPDVYAIGDSALARGATSRPLRMSCASGIPMAWQAADAIVARLTGGTLPHWPLAYVHQCISLGRRAGVIQLVTADDRARRLAVGGRVAAWYKDFVCATAAFAVTHPMPYPARRRRRRSHTRVGQW